MKIVLMNKNLVFKTHARIWQIKMIHSLVLIAAIIILSSCKTKKNKTDKPVENNITNQQVCQIDNSTSFENATIITANEKITECIYPVSDIDWYIIENNNPNNLLMINLSNQVPLTTVDLGYTIFKEDKNTIVSSVFDNNGGDGITSIIQRHFLETTGLYYINVRDMGNDEQDDFNPYYLLYSTISEPDIHEPNSTTETAVELNLQNNYTAIGFISYQDDSDWYKLNISADNMLIKLNLTTESLSDIDYSLKLYDIDTTSLLDMKNDTNGNDEPTNLSTLIAAAHSGIFYIKIEDLDNNDSNIENPYQLKVELIEDPDINESLKRNDKPENATAITSGTTLNGASISSKGDNDWYKIQASTGSSFDSPSLIEVIIESDNENLQTSNAIVLSASIIYPHEQTNCSLDNECLELNTENNCSKDVDCPSNECLPSRKCAGSGFCLNSKCGVLQYLKIDSDLSGKIHTSVPGFVEGDYYILVRNFQSEKYDPESSYNITVNTYTENDINEPNGIYGPYADRGDDNSTRRKNIDYAVQVPIEQIIKTECPEIDENNDQGNNEDNNWDNVEDDCIPEIIQINYQNIQGQISYEGDQDWFNILIPEEAETEENPINWKIEVEYSLEQSSVEHFFFVFRGDNLRNHASFGLDRNQESEVNESIQDVIGDDECLYLCHSLPRPLYIRVTDANRNDFDFEANYNFKITLKPECPELCNCERNCP